MKMFGKLFLFAQRRRLTTISLLMYFILWAFCLDFFHKLKNKAIQSCGAANGALLILVMAVFFIYLVTTLVLFIVNKGQNRQDFFIALLLILLPVLIAILYTLP